MLNYLLFYLCSYWEQTRNKASTNQQHFNSYFTKWSKNITISNWFKT